MVKKKQTKKIRNKRRFSLGFAIIVILGIVGYLGFRLYASYAAGYMTIVGHITDQNNRPAPGITLNGCNGIRSTVTDGTGQYTMVVPNDAGGGASLPTFCINVNGIGLPANYSNLTATNAAPGQPTYEWQAGGIYCYHNYTNCGPGKPFGVPSQSLDYDFPTDDKHYDFKVTYTDKTPPSVPGSLHGSAVSTSQINLGWNASTDNYSGIATYDIYRNNIKVSSTSATSFAMTGLAAATTYNFYVIAWDKAGNKSGASNVASIATPRPPGGGGNNNGGGSNNNPGGSNTKPQQQVGDGTSPLGPPSNLTISSNIVGVILNWSLATGGKGDISYQVDRSTDGSNWENIASATIGSTYVDTTAKYSTHYSYRVRAVDSGGSQSSYIAAEITTDSFTPNAGPDNEQSFTSDDGFVTVLIPTGSLDQDAACSIVNQASSQSVSDSAQASNSLIAGPYLLICKSADDNLIQDFKSNITLKLKVSDDLAGKYSSIKFVADQNSEGKYSSVKADYDSKEKTFSYKTNKAFAFGLMGGKKADVSKYVTWGILGLVLIGLAYFFIKKKDAIIEWFYRR